MKKWKDIFRYSIVSLAILLGTLSCSTSTTLVSSWADPLAQGVTYNKFVIMAIFRNPANGETFEKRVSEEFRSRGLKAVPRFALEGMDTDLSREEMEMRVNDSGADGVLIFRMIAVDMENTYVRPTTYVVKRTKNPGWWSDPYWGYYHTYPHHYWGNWHTSTQVVWAPGYWESNLTYRIETSLYRASDKKLVWTATSSTYDPQGESDLAESLSKSVLKSLKRAGYLATK